MFSSYYSRYIFFYANFLINQKKFLEVKNVYQDIDYLKSTLLIAQSKKWIDEEKYGNFEKIFSCQNSKDIISEFLFLISNLHSSEGNLRESNFYINLSNFLNPEFKFNLMLLADNYLKNKDYKKTKNILKKFDKKNGIYHWHKIKKFLR